MSTRRNFLGAAVAAPALAVPVTSAQPTKPTWEDAFKEAQKLPCMRLREIGIALLVELRSLRPDFPPPVVKRELVWILLHWQKTRKAQLRFEWKTPTGEVVAVDQYDGGLSGLISPQSNAEKIHAALALVGVV